MCNPITTRHPESLLARGTDLGYQWEVTHNMLGYRCGYLRVPPGHPWHGKAWEDIRGADGGQVRVHGELNFFQPDTDNAWWVGFDCGHASDAADPDLPGYNEMLYRWQLDAGLRIRSTGYVIGECRRLAAQAAEAAEAANR